MRGSGMIKAEKTRKRDIVMKLLQDINQIIAIAICLCFAYRILYIIVRLVRKDKPHGAPVPHDYAVLIAARNESAVIGDLLDSIHAQDYPSDHITVFVVADNCTDDTAAIARAHRAVVWERRDRSRIGKGYALNFLLRNIHRVYGDRFDGYFVFDADNLLDPSYITEMNRTFSDGYPILTSYRNSKNYGDNWISAGYSLWFLSESEYLNHARMLLGTSCMVSGVGYQFHNRQFTESGAGSHQSKTDKLAGRGVIENAGQHGLKSGDAGVFRGDTQGKGNGQVAQGDGNAVPQASPEPLRRIH